MTRHDDGTGRRMTRFGSPWAVLAVAAAVSLLAACGGSSDEASTTTSRPATTRPASTTSTTAAADEVSDAPAKPSAGCAPTTEDAKPVTLEQRTIDMDGTERSYLLTTPPADAGTDGPRPLVIDFHGLAEGNQVHSMMTQFSPKAQEEGFVVAFPQGTGTVVHWLSKAGSPDVAFASALLDRIEADECIDLNRVYATGLSNGAFMASTAACEMADRFAAIAPVAGLQRQDSCSPSRPVPVLTYHGTADPILLFNGGIDVAALDSAMHQGKGAPATTTTRPSADLEGEGYPAAVRAWAEGNGCEATPKDTKVSATVTHRVYDCPEGADVEFYVIEGGGHAWPSSEFSKKIGNVVGPTTFDIDATALNWAFFQRFALQN